mgnify:CR=1 FL=1
MKRFVLLTLLLVVCGTTFSQQLRVVKELYKDENNTLAVKYPRKDTRGDNCGLILVGLVMPDANGGRIPSLGEIGAGLGISKSTVSKYLNIMKSEGLIDFEGHRGIFTKQM